MFHHKKQMNKPYCSFFGYLINVYKPKTIQKGMKIQLNMPNILITSPSSEINYILTHIQSKTRAIRNNKKDEEYYNININQCIKWNDIQKPV